MFLMMFAVVALVVGSFVIYNAFSITVAQRTKETALLRAIGAKRKQVMRTVDARGVVHRRVRLGDRRGGRHRHGPGLRSVLTAFGVELPAGAHGRQLDARSSISMVVGIVVTVLAAYLPARKAAKVAPIEALRDVAVDRTGTLEAPAVSARSSRVAGAAFIAHGPVWWHGAGPVGLGALAVFVGVAVLGPVIARPFAAGRRLRRCRRSAGWPARWPGRTRPATRGAPRRRRRR